MASGENHSLCARKELNFDARETLFCCCRKLSFTFDLRLIRWYFNFTSINKIASNSSMLSVVIAIRELKNESSKFRIVPFIYNKNEAI